MEELEEKYVGQIVPYGEFTLKIKKVVSENLVSGELYNKKDIRVTDVHTVPIKDISL